jgi:hypothetical protein
LKPIVNINLANFLGGGWMAAITVIKKRMRILRCRWLAG